MLNYYNHIIDLDSNTLQKNSKELAYLIKDKSEFNFQDYCRQKKPLYSLLLRNYSKKSLIFWFLRLVFRNRINRLSIALYSNFFASYFYLNTSLISLKNMITEVKIFSVDCKTAILIFELLKVREGTIFCKKHYEKNSQQPESKDIIEKANKEIEEINKHVVYIHRFYGLLN